MKFAGYKINNPLLLAPMEDVTDISFRSLCKDFGADIVFTEFINSEGLSRKNEKTQKKMMILDTERPVGIQIYGEKIESMKAAAIIAEEQKPDVIDINAGCWVKKIANRGAGAGLLKDLNYLKAVIEAVVKSVKVPVTVKTRIGWDADSIKIEQIAQITEDAGAKALTIHCRTKSQGHLGDPDWSWIPVAKKVVNIPIILNGGVFSAEDVVRAFKETGADGVMIARGAITRPWIFKEAKELLESGKIKLIVDPEFRILNALKHLKASISIKGERRALLEFRKFYAGYLKGLYNASTIRNALMKILEYREVEDLLLNYLAQLKSKGFESNVVN